MVEQTLPSLLSCYASLAKPGRPASFLNISFGLILVHVAIGQFRCAIWGRRDGNGTLFAWRGQIILIGGAIVLSSQNTHNSIGGIAMTNNVRSYSHALRLLVVMKSWRHTLHSISIAILFGHSSNVASNLPISPEPPFLPVKRRDRIGMPQRQLFWTHWS